MRGTVVIHRLPLIFSSIATVCCCEAAAKDNEVFGEVSELLKVQWITSLPEFDLSQLEYSLLAGKEAWVLSSSGDTHIGLDPREGVPIWEKVQPYDRGIRPVRCKNAYIVATNTGHVVALDLRTGVRLWCLESQSRLLYLRADEEAFCVVTKDRSLTLYDGDNGKTLWSRVFDVPLSQPPLLCRFNCVVALESGDLLSLNKKDGSLQWERLLANPVKAPLSAASGVLFVLTHAGVCALSEKTAQTLWEQPWSKKGGVSWAFYVKSNAGPFVLKDQVFILGESGLYDLRVLDFKTGWAQFAVSLHGTPFLGPVALGHLVFLTLDRVPQEFLVFDRERGYITRRGELPSDLFLVEQSGTDFYFVEQNRVGRAKVNLHSLNLFREAAFKKSGLVFVPPLFVMSILILSAAIYALAGKPKIPPTYETGLRLWVIRLMLLILCSILAYAGYLLFEFWRYSQSPGHLSFAFACLLVSPVICLVVSHTIGYRLHLRRLLRSCSTATDPLSTSSAAMRHHVNEIQTEMGLSHPVGIAISERENISPVVLGTSPRNAFLLLPRNLEALAVRACHGDKALASGLLRLVLAHELAHIRNGDIRAIPLMHAVRGGLSGCLIAIFVGYLLIAWFQLDEAVVLLSGPAVMFMISGWLFLRWALKSTLVERERLADATAVLYVRPQLIERLTQEPQTGKITLAAFEHFVFCLKSPNMFAHSFLGFELSRTSGSKKARGSRFIKGKKQITQFREEVLLRGRLLLTKEVAVFGRVMPEPRKLCVAGFLGAFLFAGFSLIIIYGFMNHVIGYHPESLDTLSEGLFEQIEEWTRIQEESITWRTFRLSIPIAISVVVGSILLLPVRDHPSGLKRFSTYQICQLAAATFLVQLIVSLGFSLLSGLIRPSFILFPAVRVSTRGFFLWVIISSLFFSGALLFRNTELRRPLKRLTAEAFVYLSWYGIVIFCGLAFLTELTWHGRLLWVMAIVIAISVLFDSPVFRWFAWDRNVSEESIRFERLFFRKVLRPLFAASEVPMSRIAGFGFLRIFLPAAFFLACLYPWLILIDVRFEEVYGELRNSLTTPSTQGIEEIQKNRWNFALKYVPLSLAGRFLGPNKLLPSTALGVAALMIALLLCIPFLVVAGLRVENERARLLRMLPLITELRQLLPLPHIYSPFRDSISLLIKSSISFKVPYLTGSGSIPLMSKTCLALEWLESRDVGSDNVRLMMDWMLHCECPQGGFSGAPGLPADISHTRHALSALKAQKISPRYPRGVHENWMNRGLSQLLHRQELKDETDWLEQTRLTLAGLSDLRSGKPMEENLKALIAQKSIRTWRDSAQSIQDTRNLLQILDFIKAQDESNRSYVQNNWLPAYEDSLASMKPDTTLPNIIDLFWILNLLFPESFRSRQTVSQAVDNLSKVYYRYHETSK